MILLFGIVLIIAIIIYFLSRKLNSSFTLKSDTRIVKKSRGDGVKYYPEYMDGTDMGYEIWVSFMERKYGSGTIVAEFSDMQSAQEFIYNERLKLEPLEEIVIVNKYTNL